MGAEQKELTVEEVSILLWIKALNDFTDPDIPEDTLDSKINKFEVESAGIEREVFEKGIEAICELGILRESGSEPEIELTTQGKAVLTALSTIKGLSDESVQKILTGTINVIKFAKEHKEEIFTIITICLSKI